LGQKSDFLILIAGTGKFMKRCAFLTMDNLDGFVSDDELAIEPLAALGWQAELISWRQTAVPWSRFDVVIIRTTWDYQNDAQAYLSVLEAINHDSHLENSLSLVRWNMHKRYLSDLEQRGIGIVPTVWGQNLDYKGLRALFAEHQVAELVIKPAIGANADDTFRLAQTADMAAFAEVEAVFGSKAFMAQPFMRGIVKEGEFSLFFFGGEYSHAILKSPKSEDFRVQEEHGGQIQAIDAEALLVYRARTAVEVIKPAPLYARVDLVRTESGDFVVMELELIEPSLYLRMDRDAPVRFAGALDAWMRRKWGGAPN
jgi:glutathione synthase/RimK-type ligase-like ATP-grasp enzyme